MKFEPSDFKDMTLNPFVDENKRIWEVYPELNAQTFLKPVYPDGDESAYYKWGNSETDRLLRFLIIFVDPESPLIKHQRDYDKRKELAFELLKLNQKHRVRQEIDQETLYFNTCLSGYFFLVNSHDYEEWFSLRMNYTQALFVLRMPLGVSDNPVEFQRKKGDISKSLADIKKPMLDLEAQLFHDPRLQKKLLSTNVDEFAGFAEKYSEELPYLSKINSTQ